jgi:hypothetical protein
VASDHLPLVARLALPRRPPARRDYVVGDALPPAE